ncbi:hypothetical protein KP509_03G016700 [Ceratopteris richardii]|uniref:Uncharacterized protein n=1 Tax=Ceratopteris richardii TaxID=49495 RepID=A0A8T2V5E5_CERRI|nr:hypothetical protein KP509_03G016700 [Ceratopteris richardii]
MCISISLTDQNAMTTTSTALSKVYVCDKGCTLARICSS